VDQLSTIGLGQPCASLLYHRQSPLEAYHQGLMDLLGLEDVLLV
jgi:hypothetical protein